MNIFRMGGRGAVVPLLASLALAGCAAKPSEHAQAPALAASVSDRVAPLVLDLPALRPAQFALPDIHIADQAVVPPNRKQVAEKPDPDTRDDAPTVAPMSPAEAKVIFSERPGHAPPSRF